MKIAINTRLLLRNQLDGIGWFTYETARRMVYSHPDVEFHFLFDRPFDKRFVFGENVKAHYLGPPARHSVLQQMWNNYSVPWMLRSIKPDIYFSPDAQLSLRTNVKQVIVIHDLNFEHYPSDIPAHYYRYLHKQSPKFAEKASRIITVSDFSKQDIISLYNISPDKIDVAWNGVNDLFHPLNEQEQLAVREKLSAGKPYFITVGSIHPRKNIHRLLAAFDQFKEKTGSLSKLLVVGNAFYLSEEIKSALQNMRYKEDVIMAGRMDADALNNAIASSIANVYISYFEGFGIPVLEGFKCGVPVLAANSSSIPEVAGDAALLIDPFNLDEISNALETLETNRTFRLELIEKGNKRVQHFSWDHTAEVVWNSLMKVI
jgi:glycosyltransferase involved in cell wall biosynthesis